jgi:pimeloyl-ACP methyl ester carboxylesterase
MLHYTQNKKIVAQEICLVLLHGFCENLHFWDYFVATISHIPIICIDLPGFGKSPQIESLKNIENIAQEVYQTLHNLQVEQYIVVGHSLGGYVALALAEKYPQSLRGIALLNSTAYADSEEKKQNRNKVIESLEQYGSKPFLSNFFPNLFYQENLAKFAQELQKLHEEAQNIEVETLIQMSKAMRDRKNYAPILANLTVPVLFIVGKNDAILPLALHQEQFFLPKDAQIVLQANTGHLSILENPIKTGQLLLQFYQYCN